MGDVDDCGMRLRAGSGGRFREATGRSLWLALELELEFVRESCLSGECGRERDGEGLIKRCDDMYVAS